MNSGDSFKEMLARCDKLIERIDFLQSAKALERRGFSILDADRIARRTTWDALRKGGWI